MIILKIFLANRIESVQGIVKIFYLLMSSLVRCHSRLSGILFRKDSGQAGVTDYVITLMYFLVMGDNEPYFAAGH
jgi:hypothetical protein